MTDRIFKYSVLIIMMFMLSKLEDTLLLILFDVGIAVVLGVLLVKEIKSGL